LNDRVNPDTDKIIEIATVINDSQLSVVARARFWPVHQPDQHPHHDGRVEHPHPWRQRLTQRVREST